MLQNDAISLDIYCKNVRISSLIERCFYGTIVSSRQDSIFFVYVGVKNDCVVTSV